MSWLFLLIFITFNLRVGYCASALTSLIYQFMVSCTSSRLIVFSCPIDANSQMQLAKDLSKEGFSAALAGPPADNTNIDRLVSLLSSETHHLSVFLDWDCPEADLLWTLVTQVEPPDRPMGPLVHWLIISNQIEKQSAMESIPGPKPALDSHVIIAEPQDNGTFDLKEIYRIGFGRDELLRIPLVRNWKSGDSFPYRVNRNNMLGAEIKIGILERGDNWTNLWDWNKKHINTVTKHGYSIIRHVFTRLNLTSKSFFRSSYGAYKKDANGFFTGIMGLLQRKEVDILSGLHLNKERLYHMDVTGVLFTYRPSFILRTPSISATDNIYFLPFSKGVWISSGIMLVICTLLFLLTERDKQGNELLEIIFICLGTIFDQGAESSPERYSSRIIFYTLLIQSVFLFNAYSACIVVLLRAPNDRIHDLQSLINSGFRIIMEDIEINRHYRYITQDPLALRLYKERVDKFPDKEVFISLQKGIDLVRRQMVAFHVDIHANKEIADTYEESEKCGLRRINMLKWQITMPLARYSPLRELMTRNLLAVNQVGLNEREFRYWYQAFPTCYNQDANFDSVTIQDFYPTIEMLAYGYLLSVLFIVGEIFYKRFLDYKKKIYKRNTPKK